MCSVIGYVGKGQCKEVVLEGLRRLEYRGYDSAGFACIDLNFKLNFVKDEGRLKILEEKIQNLKLDGNLAIGHTRWATHGIVSENNAHPQLDCNKKIAVVHNGIIDNFQTIKNSLQQNNHRFVSQTDTEIIAHLLEDYLSKFGLKEAINETVNKIKGTYAFIVISEKFPDIIIIARKKSPLCIGVGKDEVFIASDVLAFVDKTNEVIFLPEESFGIIKKDKIELFDFKGSKLPLNSKLVDAKWKISEKGKYESFMLKEIYEQKQAVNDTLQHYKNLEIDKILDQLKLTESDIKNLKSIHIIGCGTSWHAARIGQFFFETICQIPTKVSLASEFKHMPFFKDENSLYIFISQSGETADTLEALNLINEKNIHTVVISNVSSSTMIREAKGFILTQAGPEVAVASTKAFSTQLTALYWLAHIFGFKKNLIIKKDFETVEMDLLNSAAVLESMIESHKDLIITQLAPFYSNFKRFIFLGRHIGYPFALEAALKLKEISYIFSQGYPAGELKHGPIALIDEETPVVLFSNNEERIYQKLLSNAQEVKSRKGHLISFAFENQKELIDLSDVSFIFPNINSLLSPLAMTGLMQFFVYQIAKVLGRPIDKPRNLAKSVTVE